MPAKNSRTLGLALGAPLLLALSALSIACLSGCEDQEKKKAELLAKTIGSTSVPTAVSSAPAALPPASAAAAAKPPKECGAEVVIDDPDVEGAIRAKAKKPKETSPEPLGASDFAALTSLKIPPKATPLAELDPCLFPRLVGLRFLYLPKGTYRDLTPISGLTKLEALFVSDSEVEDLKPIERLVLLDQLGLGRTHVKDLSVVGNLPNLTELVLDDTRVTDLGPLAKNAKLMSLSIKNTLVTDLSPLKDLKKLTKLYIAGTSVTNLDVLDPLKARGLKIILK